MNRGRFLHFSIDKRRSKGLCHDYVCVGTTVLSVVWYSKDKSESRQDFRTLEILLLGSARSDAPYLLKLN